MSLKYGDGGWLHLDWEWYISNAEKLSMLRVGSVIAILLAMNCNNEQNKMQLNAKCALFLAVPLVFLPLISYFPNPNASMWRKQSFIYVVNDLWVVSL